jgi:hypothetical protein
MSERIDRYTAEDVRAGIEYVTYADYARLREAISEAMWALEGEGPPDSTTAQMWLP